MLETMRRKAKYFYVLFGIVILSFVFWGIGNKDQGGPVQYVAEVGDQRVSLTEYWRRYDRTADLYREVYKEKVDEKMLRDLKDTVLNSMVTEMVLAQAAADAGLSVSDAELEEAIMGESAFQESGVFSSDLYMGTIRANRMTPAQYEDIKRRELLVSKMRRAVESAIELSPVEEAAIAGNEKLGEKLREAILDEKRSSALKSYVDGLMGRIPVVVNRSIIS
jgi:peptidyl-prolyl cis-trans isomerase D